MTARLFLLGFRPKQSSNNIEFVQYFLVHPRTQQFTGFVPFVSMEATNDNILISR